MLLAGLQRQDVWACRSRIHIMATANPPYTPCVYLGKSGLLGGAPTQQVPSPGEEKWRSGPFMKLDSDETKTVVFHIPSGNRYKDYRFKTGPVIQRASLTIRYVEANNEEDIRRLVASNDDTELKTQLNAGFQAVPLGTFEGGFQSLLNKCHQEVHVQRTKHAGLVLFGKTKKDKLCRKGSKIDVQLEICAESLMYLQPWLKM